MASLSVGAAGAGRVGLDDCDRVTFVVREEVVVAKVGLERFLAEPVQFICAGGRAFARMTLGAVLGKDDLAPLHNSLVLGNVILAARRVFEPERLQTHKKLRDVFKLLLRGEPVDRILLRRLDGEWLLLGQPDESIVLLQPMLGIAADIDIDAKRRPRHSYRIGAVLKHVRYFLLRFDSR